MLARKSWYLKNLAMSFIPSNLAWSGVAPASLMAAIVAGLLSVSHLYAIWTQTW